MSWIVLTALMLAVAFAACFLLCEWVVRGGRRDGGDGPSATG